MGQEGPVCFRPYSVENLKWAELMLIFGINDSHKLIVQIILRSQPHLKLNLDDKTVLGFLTQSGRMLTKVDLAKFERHPKYWQVPTR